MSQLTSFQEQLSQWKNKYSPTKVDVRECEKGNAKNEATDSDGDPNAEYGLDQDQDRG